MKRGAVLCALLSLWFATGAHASAMQQTALKAGLIGVWADECGRPVSQDNPYDTYALAKDGSVSEVYSTGPNFGKNRYRWVSAQRRGADQLVLEGVFYGNGLGQHVVIQIRDGKMRTLQSHDSSGRDLVVNGAFPDGGGPSLQTRCSGR